jgi:hypothetical protein
LICSTELFSPPTLAFTESMISFHTFAFSAFVITFVCFHLIMVMFFSTSSHRHGEIFTSLSFFFWADDFWHFFYKEYYGIMGYYSLVKLLTHGLVIHSTIQRLSNVKLSSGYGTTG